MTKVYPEELRRKAVEMAMTRPVAQVANELGVSRKSVENWAVVYGVIIPRRPRKLWTEQEEHYLAVNAGKIRPSEMAEHLGKGTEAVKSKMAMMGLSTNTTFTPFTREQINFVIDNNGTMSRREMAKMFGRTKNAIDSLAWRLGLAKPRGK